MPSLHFGYSLLIGVSLIQLPVSPRAKNHRLGTALPLTESTARSSYVRVPSAAKVLCEVVGFLYPVSVLAAIIATANHFILDAVAGGAICLLALWCNASMKNLLPVEDYVLWCLRIHKPTCEQPAPRSRADYKP